jgi:hypothetical protein
MNAALGLDDIAHFSDFQGKGGVLEWFLHLPGPKETKVSSLASGAAV